MSVLTFACKRLLQAIPLLAGVIVINFIIIHLAPGDPVLVIAGEYGTTPEYLAMMRAKMGLDQPLPVQLFVYLKTTLGGDLGHSFVWNQPVLGIILEYMPATLLLMGASLSLAILIGVPLGVWASRKPYSLVDNGITTLCLAGYSIPVFWFGLMGILLFSVYLRWLPTQGMKTIASSLTGVANWLDIGRHLVLPATVLALAQLALVARLARASMLEVMSLDFITTAWSKGLGEGRVIFRHGLRNALLPLVTIVGLQIGYMFGGAILTETVFAWPGLGRLMLRALGTRDYPLIMGMFIVITVLIIFANLITDVAYAVLDPRIRYGKKK
jgi:ABC-type dipeptide/oligopeptide/nickel transport system permease component